MLITPRSASAFMLLSSLAIAQAACSETIPAHELDATLSYDGKEYHVVLSFPERDPEAMNSAGDSSCDFFSGNCGSTRPTVATVKGDAPIVSATMTTTSDGSAITYDILVQRSKEDEAAWDAEPTPYETPTAVCRVYGTELDTESPCYYTTKTCTITLSPRD